MAKHENLKQTVVHKMEVCVATKTGLKKEERQKEL